MRRAAVLMVVAATLVGLVAACDDDGWDPDAQFAPSLRPAFGARVVDGKLSIWTGAPCQGVTRVSLDFDPQDARLVLTSTAQQGAEFEYLTLEPPHPGLEVSEPLPQGFDWRSAEKLQLIVESPSNPGGSYTDIAEVVDGSAERPADTYWFQDVGWLNPAEVAEQNGTSFLGPCTPDPAKTPSLPTAFGARVTDGELRLWTGSTCAATVGVNLSFEPSGAQVELAAPDDVRVEFDRLTYGEPVPGLEVITSPPDGFDWRTEESVQLRVRNVPPAQTATTDLAEVVDSSAKYPDDTYWFQGFGWLTPDEVAEQDGTTFLALCTPEE